MAAGVESVRRAVRILETLAQDSRGLMLAEVSRRAELSKPTVFRLINTLVTEGLVHQDAVTKRYRLGARMIALGRHALEGTELLDVARPFLTALTERLPLIAYLNVPTPTRVLAIDRVPRLAGVEFVRVGYEMPYHACASGLVFMAFGPPELARAVADGPLERFASGTIATKDALERAIAEVRESCYAEDHNSLEEGVSAVAAPIRDHAGEAIAALGVTGITATMEELGWDHVREETRQTAAEISARLGYGAPEADKRGQPGAPEVPGVVGRGAAGERRVRVGDGEASRTDARGGRRG
jgi:IclR family KDG regulon transcriptional repressor